MKKVMHYIRFPFLLALVATLLQGCLKDNSTRSFTMYIPVYKTTAEVRANIKNGAGEPISNPGKMFVLGSFIFLNEVDKGVHIIDNSNPAKPINKYFINIPGNVDLAVKGNTLYADLYSDMVTMDISNPEAVKVTKIIDDAFPNRRYSNGFVADTSKIIVAWERKDTVVGYNDTWQSQGRWISMDAMGSVRSQTAFSAAKGISGSMARFTLMDNYLYTVTDNMLNVFNITQPQNPSFSNKVNVGWGIETIYPFKNNLFIGSTTGMFIYGTSNPAQPNRISSFSHVRSCDPVIADDDFAYVTLRSGNACAGFTNQMDVLNIQNLSSPSLVKTYPLTNPHGLSKDGNLLFVCDGAAGLRVFDAANPAQLKSLQTIPGLDTYDVITTNGIAIVVAKEGLYQFDYSNPADLKLLSKLSLVKK